MGFEETSTFNEGALQIQRLNYLWMQANNYSREGLLQEWCWTLDALWRELVRDVMRQGGKQDADSFDKDMENNAWVKKFRELRSDVSLKMAEQDGLLYKSLNDLEVFLRVLQDAVGKGGKYRDPAVDDMD